MAKLGTRLGWRGPSGSALGQCGNHFRSLHSGIGSNPRGPAAMAAAMCAAITITVVRQGEVSAKLRLPLRRRLKHHRTGSPTIVKFKKEAAHLHATPIPIPTTVSTR